MKAEITPVETGIAKAIRLATSQTALAKMINCTPQAVQRWSRQGYPSKKGCPKIEAALNGRVTRAELLPEIFGEIHYERDT
jgi:DNA-binding transcriptional regulator YdaS (Cro superfamily)